MIIIYLVTTVILIWLLKRQFYGLNKAKDIIGVIMFLFLIQVLRDLGIGPLVAEITGFSSKLKTYSDMLLFTHATGYAALKAWLLMASYYAFLFLGMRFVFFVKMNKGNLNPYTDDNHQYSQAAMNKAWNIGFVFFIVGCIAEIIVIKYLITEISFRDIPSSRAIFSSSLNLTNPIYNYSRIISVLLIYGPLAMLAFSSGNRRKLFYSLIALIISVVVEIIAGGRGKVITAVMIIIFIYHYSVKPISLRAFIRMSVVIVFLLMVTVFFRYKLDTFWESSRGLISAFSIGNTLRLDQVAWIMDIFPEKIPFTGWDSSLAILAGYVPSMEISSQINLWSIIVDYYFRGINPMSGIGGMSFSSPAILYAWGGDLTTIFFAFLFGIIFGLLFSWLNKNISNRFLILLAAILIIRGFFIGIQTRLPDAMGGFNYSIIPIALMAALSIGMKSRAGFIMITLILFDAILFICWRFANIGSFKTLIMISTPLITIISLVVLSNSGPTLSRQDTDKDHLE